MYDRMYYEIMKCSPSDVLPNPYLIKFAVASAWKHMWQKDSMINRQLYSLVSVLVMSLAKEELPV